jgi:hypothetical protein
MHFGCEKWALAHDVPGWKRAAGCAGQRLSRADEVIE